MRINRFYRPELQDESRTGSLLTINDSAFLHQLVKVLRLQKGEKITFFSEEKGDVEVEITELSLKEGVFMVGKQRKKATEKEPTVEVSVVIPALRKERLEWLVEKISELGAKELFLVSTHRSQPRSYKIDRLQKIAIEAAEQCGRQHILKIFEKGSIKNVIEEEEGEKLVCRVPNVSSIRKNEYVPSGEARLGKTFIFIGPEGGWSEEEEKYFDEKKLPSLSLGSLVLRAETAAIAALVLVSSFDHLSR